MANLRLVKSAGIGDVYVTVPEAVNAINSANAYIAGVNGDFKAWVANARARGNVTSEEAALATGWGAFVDSWATFYNKYREGTSGIFGDAYAMLHTRENKEQAASFLEQAKAWRAKLEAMGGRPSTPAVAPSITEGSAYKPPSAPDLAGAVPWYVWAIGGVVVLGAAFFVLSPARGAVAAASRSFKGFGNVRRTRRRRR